MAGGGDEVGTTSVSTTTAAGRPRETQAARSARTRGALLDAARALLAEKGVAAAVVEQLEGELVDLVVAAALKGSGVQDQLHRGCRAYMDACADPTMARILADAPAVLGIEACRALDAVACAPLLAEVFAPAEEELIAVPGDPEGAAALLLGFLNEAAGLIAAAPTDQALRRRVGDTVDEF